MSHENQQPEQIKEYYIAYFDLLGYKNFFRNHPDEVENFLQYIHEAVSLTDAYIQEVNSSPVAIQFGKLFIRIKVFSDNILLCLETTTTDMEYPRFLAFLTIIADIQRNFILKYGLFLRGGITIGKLSFNEDYVFGQGLIDAVELEEKAIYPRIIIGQTVLDYVLKPHFVSKDDLGRACDIENRAHSGEKISDAELAFCNSITEYMSRAKDDQIHRMAVVLGLDEEKLRSMMALKVTDATINEFGRFDALKVTVDKKKAKEYFEKMEGAQIIPPKVPTKIDKLLREFIVSGGFDIEQ